MKLTQQQVELILHFKSLGASSRNIASELGIGKTTVNNVVNRNRDKLAFNPQKEGAKIAVVDVETAAALVLAFQRWDVNISEDHVVREGGQMLVVSWRWLGTRETFEVHMSQDEVLDNLNDYWTTKALYEVYEQADAVVMHNGKKFDHKVAQTRGLVNGLGILPSVKVIDTLVLAKNHLKLPSNKLDSIGAYFGYGRKNRNDGILLWKKVQEGDEAAMQEMVEYCKQDVNLLHDIYLGLRSLTHTGFNAGLYYQDEIHRCKSCGSEDVEPTGKTIKTSVGVYDEYVCNECGNHSRHPMNKLSKFKRKSLLR